jgi:putative membrane protein
MVLQASFAYLHFLFLFILVATLVMEWMLYAPQMSNRNAMRLMRIDAVYGASALVVVGSGFARAIWFGKGAGFYFENPIFWAKVAVFIIWAGISIPPTVHYLSWMKAVKQGQDITVDPKKFKTIRKCLKAQMHLLPIVPLLAVLMARGFGL